MKYSVDIYEGIINSEGARTTGKLLDSFELLNIGIDEARENVASALLNAAHKNGCFAIAEIYDAPLHQVGSWAAEANATPETIDTWFDGQASTNDIEWNEGIN